MPRLVLDDEPDLWDDGADAGADRASYASHASGDVQRAEPEIEDEQQRPGRLKQLVRIASRCLLRTFGCVNRNTLKLNAWVSTGDRETRLEMIRMNRDEVLSDQARRWWADGVGDTRIFLRKTRWKIRGHMRDITATLKEMFKLVDAKTGLPRIVLGGYVFEQPLQSGYHGYAFVGVMDDSSASSARYQSKVCIRLRDRSRPAVMRILEGRGTSFLKKDIVERHNFLCLKSMLRAVKLAKPPFFHGCLVEHFAFFDSREWFIEVAEYMPGGSLHEHLQRKESELNEHDAAHIVSRIFLALQYLHSNRLMHRDVRLRQILLPEPYPSLSGAKLGDFWMLERIPKKGMLVDGSRPVDICSTSPEVNKSGHWTAKADIWATGCVLFELTHGYPPFGGQGQALVQRVCTQKPEFGRCGGQLSVEPMDLLRSLLQRNYTKRPTAEEALDHKYFRFFKGEKPEERFHRSPRKINTVKVIGKKPRGRNGMVPEDVLSAKAGTMNRGFCTYMAALTCTIDFEIKGPAEDREYWITHIAIGLWGNGDNPRNIRLQCADRPDSNEFADVTNYVVASKFDVDACIRVDRPLQYLRLQFKQNYGGSNGIAFRKICFYGFEVRSVPVYLDLTDCDFERGASLFVHSDKLTGECADMLPSLRRFLITGKRILGSAELYKVYRDASSGPAHRATHVLSQPLDLPDGMHIIAAVCGLRYHAAVPEKSTGVQIAINLNRYTEVMNESGRDDETGHEPSAVSARSSRRSTVRRRRSSGALDGTRSYASGYTAATGVTAVTAVTQKSGGLRSTGPHSRALGMQDDEDDEDDDYDEVEVELGEKILLFQSDPLPSTPWPAQDIMAQGYSEHPLTFCSGIRVTTDDLLRIELRFLNNAGTLHVPVDMGLRLYFVPLLPTPASSVMSDISVGEDGNTHAVGDAELGERRQKNGQHIGDIDDIAFPGYEAEQMSAKQAEALEKELQKVLDELQHETIYGNYGLSQSHLTNAASWIPDMAVMPVKGRRQLEKDRPSSDSGLLPSKDPWWERTDREALEERRLAEEAAAQGEDEEWKFSWSASDEQPPMIEEEEQEEKENHEDCIPETGMFEQLVDEAGKTSEETCGEERQPDTSRRHAMAAKQVLQEKAKEFIKHIDDMSAVDASARRDLRLSQTSKRVHRGSVILGGLPSSVCGAPIHNACGDGNGQNVCHDLSLQHGLAASILTAFTPSAPPPSPRP